MAFRFTWLIACVCVAAILSSPAHADERKARDPQVVAEKIDAHILKKLAKDKIPASASASDAEFLRRTSLLVTGRLPTPERAVAYFNSTDTAKRGKVVDELLGSPFFGEHFANHWSTLITAEEPKYRNALGKWLANEFNQNTPWSRIVGELITHEGGGPKMGFVMSNIDNNQPQPNKLAGATSRLFLGVQLHCAECHNHPFTNWKQSDFWGVAAFYSRVKFQQAKGKEVAAGISETLPVTVAKNKKDPPRAGAFIVIPTTAGKNAGTAIAARFLEGDAPSLPKEGAVRGNLADWVTSPNNKYFAKAFVNRMWAHFLGRGLVHPIDDMHDDNQPTHPEVLQLLTEEFTSSDFDVKHLVRCITATQAYQRTSSPVAGNKDEIVLASRQNVQVMNAEVLYDALTQALGVPQLKIASGGGTAGAASGRPMASNNPRDRFVKLFSTTDADGSPTDYTHGIPQALALMNDPAFNTGGPTVDKLMKAHTEPAKVIEGLFLATLSRLPTSQETKLLTAYVARRPDRRQGYAGVQWILLNTEEFVLIR